MTTIASSRREVAFDTRTVEDAKYWRADDKVVRVRNYLVGCAGDDAQIQEFLRCLRNPRRKKPELSDLVALALGPDGIWHYRNSMVGTPVHTPFFAIGSGEGYALGAMSAGKSPKEAVEIAADWDPNTGRPVLVMVL